MRIPPHFLRVLAIFLLSAALVFAQTNTGDITGVVRDPSGAVVPNATVTLKNVDTGFTRTFTTGGQGQYVFSALPVGTYEINAQGQGFSPVTQRIQVTVGSRNTADLALSVAGASQTIEVVGVGGAVVNTEDQQQSTVVNTEQISSLPTLTRNAYDLVALSGNVQADQQAGLGDARGAGFSINGQRSASTNILLDGGENVDTFTATAGQPVPLDSVQEFRVITNGMTAEYGRAAGGVVNVATKAGGNSFHGSAYEFNRISALASNTYYNASNGIQKPTFTRNQFGFSLGGPFIKDKLFFFENAEWIRVRSSAPQTFYIPDPAFIAAAQPPTQAFFSALGKLRPDARVTAVVPASQVTGYTGSTFGAYTGPVFDKVTYNTANNAGAENPQNTFLSSGRVDWNITNSTQLFGRYSFRDRSDFPGTINTSPYAGFETGQTFYDNNFLGSLTHAFSSNVVSNTRVDFNRLNDVQPLGKAPVGPTLYMNNGRALRFQGTQIAFPGYNETTPGNAIPFGGPQNLGQIFEDLTWVHGNHTFKFGGQYIYTQDNRAFGAYEEAVEALSSSSTGVALNNFLTGNLAVFQAAVYPQGKFPCPVIGGKTQISPACTVTLPVTPPSFARSNLYNDGAAYGQDTWKVSPRLTLDLGLRWEYFGVQHNKHPNLDSNFYYGSGNTYFNQIRSGIAQTVPNSPIGGLWHKQPKNFGPRIGFAYDVFGNGSTSLRGGYGISYERNFGNVTYNVIQNPPNYAVLSITPADVGSNIPVTTNNSGPLAGNTGSKALPRVSLRHVDQNIKTAYVHQWNLGLERQVTRNLIASLVYNGARGIHQYSISNLNEPGYASNYLGDTVDTRLNQQFTNINSRGSNGDSYYNAGVASLRGRIWGSTVTATYTYSHSMDTLSSTFSDEVQNNALGFLDPFNPGLDLANSDYDARHRLSVSLVAPITPFADRSSNWFVKEIVGGFQIAPIFTYHTGYPFTVFDCSFSNSQVGNCPRADVSGRVSKGGSNNLGPDQGGDVYNYITVPAIVGQYQGPAVVPGTSTPFPGFTTTGNSNLPTCTGLFHTGCSFPSNMLRRNSFIGPPVWNWDLAVFKNFAIGEGRTLQFRGEFYDIINHKNFYVLGYGVGGADVSSSTTIQAQKGGYGNPFDERRNVQLAVRFTF